jgi:HIRAN domain
MALRTMSLPVVGLSHDDRTEVLRQFARDGGAAVVARQADNAADANAIAVRLATKGEDEPVENWVLVGYVAADRAAILAPLFDRKYFRGISFVLNISWRPESSVPKVVLVMSYEVEDGEPGKQIRAARSSHLVAELKNIRWDNIEGLPNGDKVSLWLHPDDKTVNVYRRGSVGGFGQMGSTSHRRLIKYLAEKLPYRAAIHSAGDRAWITVAIGDQGR